MEREVERFATAKEGFAVDYIFERDAESILEVLLPRFLNYSMWRVLLESNAAEQGARMVAMDNATTNADDLLRDLKLKYNRARQDAITKELIEITSGADALANK
jgi:F-type H+-transporting ATPase subunit gamma